MTYKRNKHLDLTGFFTKKVRSADAITSAPKSDTVRFRRWPNLTVDAGSPMARFLIGSKEKMIDSGDDDHPSVRRMMFSAIDPETP